MKTETTRSTWEDVVFEARNKAYGAYSIRRSYDKNVSSASMISIGFAALVFGVLQLASLMHLEIKIIPPVIRGKELTALPKILADQLQKKTLFKKQPATRDLPVRVVKQVVIDTPPIKPVDPPQTGDEPGKGEPGGVNNVGVDVQTNMVIAPVVEPPKVFDHPEVMPSYEGGVKAMVRFISRTIHYPGSARAMGQEGTVYVKFVINNLGQVVDVEILKGVNATLDREAMRVVTAMNKWRPGMQNNLPVNVRMVLPIKFQLEDE